MPQIRGVIFFDTTINFFNLSYSGAYEGDQSQVCPKYAVITYTPFKQSSMHCEKLFCMAELSDPRLMDNNSRAFTVSVNVFTLIYLRVSLA